ncbi:hypothetical protein [Alkaliphilus crotonatoxidans]
MKFKKALYVMLILTMVFCTGFSVSANEISAQEHNIDTIQETTVSENFNTLEKTKRSINLNNHFENGASFTDNLNPIQGKILEPTVVDELQISESTDALEEETPEVTKPISPLLTNSYYWNYRTAYFQPSTMTATDDIDIVWNRYQPGNEDTWSDDYQPMGYPSLYASTFVASENQSVYSTNANQGHVNDYLGSAVYGSHSYYTVMTGNWDTVTALASKKVRVRIADMTTNSLVFDSGYGTDGESYSPAAGGNVQYFSTSSTTSFGASKDVYHVRFDTSVGARVYCVILSPYNPYYPSTWDEIDNLDPTYHYAFYAGQAVPGRATISNISAHNSSVSYNGYASFESPVSSTTISASTPVSQNNLYALRSVTVKEYVSSQNNLYLSNLSYKIKWPDHFSFYYLNGSPDTYSYTFTQSASPIGVWQFMFSGIWKDATNRYNTFLGRTHMTIDYLAPYGYIVK